jgi:hypothetical protein
MSDGIHRFTATLHFGEGSVVILQDGDPVPVAKGTLPEVAYKEPFLLQMSLFDQQVVLAVNGEPLVPACEYERDSTRPLGKASLRLGASDIDCEVSHLTVYRDIYYSTKSPHGATAFTLGEEELFVLGDNSPVSMDSRVWDNPAVPISSLIGKPIVVHLPSQQKEVTWGGKPRYIRIPDFSRIRYIR